MTAKHLSNLLNNSKIKEEFILEGKKVFSKPCKFMFGITEPTQMPQPNLPEVAFVGASNVGKSSLINALTRQKKLCRVSKNPGSTQQINFFNLGDIIWLVDLPGYGFAKVSKQQKKHWNQLINFYLNRRPTLRRVLLLVDCRHGIKPLDLNIMDILSNAAVVFEIIITKIDKLNDEEVERAVSSLKTYIEKYSNCFPRIIATSSQNVTGVDILRGEIVFVSK